MPARGRKKLIAPSEVTANAEKQTTRHSQRLIQRQAQNTTKDAATKDEKIEKNRATSKRRSTKLIERHALNTTPRIEKKPPAKSSLMEPSGVFEKRRSNRIQNKTENYQCR